MYRSRREEALRRLDKTQRNLERVEDIMLELETRMRSLERQAKRANDYERVKNDLHLLLREWYGFHWHKAQEELSESMENAKIHADVLQKERDVLKTNRDDDRRMAEGTHKETDH